MQAKQEGADGRIGYKLVAPSLQGKDGFMYCLGETYHHSEEVIMCESGFHYSDSPLFCYLFFPREFRTPMRFLLVEDRGPRRKHWTTGYKSVTSTLFIKKELTGREWLDECLRFGDSCPRTRVRRLGMGVCHFLLPDRTDFCLDSQGRLDGFFSSPALPCYELWDHGKLLSSWWHWSMPFSDLLPTTSSPPPDKLKWE